MKTFLKILAIFLLIVSCQENKKEGSLSSSLEKENTTQNNNTDSSKDLQSKTTLIEQEFNDFFPKNIGDYKLVNISESTILSRTIISAFYLKGDNMKNNIEYSLEDGNSKGSSVVKDFEASYNYKNKGEGETAYIYKERNGYKTIAFLQPADDRNEIRFIYKQRFSISLEGSEHPDKLWSYIKEEDLKKLDNY